MEELGVWGEATVVRYHLPRLHCDLCRHTKERTKAQVFGRTHEQPPKLSVRPTHHLLSVDIGIIDGHLFVVATKHAT